MSEPLARDYTASALTVRDRTFVWGERTYLMAVINATPDSFSGDGTSGDPVRAVELTRHFEANGADIIDIGAESSRPGADPIDPAIECRRLLPSLQAVRDATNLPISVDTYHPEIARAALAAGADIINDIHGLRADSRMAGVIAAAEVPVVAMHNQRGRKFHDVAGDIRAGFEATVELAGAAGITRDRLILDPGFGFGWQPERNLEMLRRLPDLWSFGLPLLLGVSRKSTIGMVLDLPADQRLEGTSAAVMMAIAGGADIVRVHDLPAMARVARMADAIVRGTWTSG